MGPIPRLDETSAREAVVEIGRRMHDQGLIAGAEGNISVRLSPRRLLITPSGVNKGFLRPGDLVTIDLEGRPEEGRRRVSSEVRLHLASYRIREDVGAVIHAHPPTAVALTLAGLSLEVPLVPELLTALGRVPTAPYATPSTEELAEGVAERFRDADVVLMERHGAVCLGPDLTTAYDRLESLEHNARIAWMAFTVGSPAPLPATERARLERMVAADRQRR